MASLSSHAAPPPIVHHTTVPLSTAKALSFLSKYLVEAETNPALHPDANLAEVIEGERSALLKDAQTGLTLHLLKRVEKGLAGEHLAPEVDYDEFEIQQLDIVGEGAAQVQIQNSEWKDKRTYELEQEADDADLGPVADSHDINLAPEADSARKTRHEERKMAKKEKRKAEKKLREQNRAKKAKLQKEEA